MAEKMERLSINALERVVKETGAGAITREWRGNDVTIRRRLGLYEMMKFVDGVVKTCFAGDAHQYTPEVLDFAIRCSVLEMYANFTLPKNVENRYDFVYGCDAYTFVLNEIDGEQFDLILDAIDEKIEHVAAARERADAVTQIADKVCSFVNAALGKLSEVSADIGEENLARIAECLQSGTMDRETLTNAVINAVNAYFDARDKRAENEQNGDEAVNTAEAE